MESTIFHELTANQFLNTRIDSIKLTKNNTLIKEDDLLQHIYFLADGELSIFKEQQLVWNARPYEFIGISSFLIGEKLHSYKVKAKKNSVLYRIPSADFKKALSKAPEFSMHIIQLFNRRINATLNKILT